MIVDDRIVAYIRSLEKDNTDLLRTIEKEALKEQVPIIRKEMESFLRVILGIKKPVKVLELGTAVAYSAILMSECIDGKITTIENYEPRINKAKENIKKAKKEEQITLLEGDATEILKGLTEEEYEFVFMDAAKAQYLNWLEDIIRVMKKDAVLICDNVLQEGDLVESKFITRRRDRTIHVRMRDFLYAIKHDDRLETTIVPIGDGITMSVKKQ